MRRRRDLLSTYRDICIHTIQDSDCLGPNTTHFVDQRNAQRSTGPANHQPPQYSEKWSCLILWCREHPSYGTFGWCRTVESKQLGPGSKTGNCWLWTVEQNTVHHGGDYVAIFEIAIGCHLVVWTNLGTQPFEAKTKYSNNDSTARAVLNNLFLLTSSHRLLGRPGDNRHRSRNPWWLRDNQW